MAERVDVLEASHEALTTELAETERQIQGCYQRAEKLRTALEALQELLGDQAVVELQQLDGLDGAAKGDGSVTKVMDKLQEGDDGKKGEKGESKESEQTPVWLEKKEA
jgi:excinuclease UvrABC nuclease subunit